MRGRTIWQFWEGPQPPYITLCLETMRRHNPDVRLLDRAGFLAMHGPADGLGLDDLSLNHLSDYARAWLLAEEGGLYVDADCVGVRPLDPLLDLAAEHGFISYREPLGYLSCNLMAAGTVSLLAAEHLSRVRARLRKGPPFRWLDLSCVPLEQAVGVTGATVHELPVRSVMAIPWHRMRVLLAERDDRDHAAFLPGGEWMVMLSNASIKGDDVTADIPRRGREELLGGRSYLSWLLRHGLGLPHRLGLAEFGTILPDRSSRPGMVWRKAGIIDPE